MKTNENFCAEVFFNDCVSGEIINSYDNKGGGSNSDELRIPESPESDLE